MGYWVQGLICVVYMPLCFQLARFTSEAASRVYADLGKDIEAGEVPDIASFSPAPATRLFYSLPVRATKHLSYLDNTRTYCENEVLNRLG